MFGLKKNRAPTQPFTHADDCKIVKADPTTQIEWVEVETGHWQAVCQCGAEDYREPPTVGRDRLDPYDPSTFRHAAQLRAPRDRRSRSPQSHLEGSGWCGRGLLVGGMRHL